MDWQRACRESLTGVAVRRTAMGGRMFRGPDGDVWMGGRAPREVPPSEAEGRDDWEPELTREDTLESYCTKVGSWAPEYFRG